MYITNCFVSQHSLKRYDQGIRHGKCNIANLEKNKEKTIKFHQETQRTKDAKTNELKNCKSRLRSPEDLHWQLRNEWACVSHYAKAFL